MSKAAKRQQAVAAPAELMRALKATPEAWERWRALSPSHKREHVDAIVESKTSATRARRIDAAVRMIVSMPLSKKAVSKKGASRAEAGGEAVFAGFPEVTFRFLRGITQNNDKAWFEAHREEYDAGYVAPARAFVAALGPRLQKIAPALQFEPRVNGSLFRIHRDVRFSKDKTPYKNHLDLWFWLGDRRGWDTPGFFFRMFSDRLIVGAGMHRFDKPKLELFRQKVLDAKSGRALMKTLAEVSAAGRYAIGGATRKKVPRGFDPEHERAHLLLHEGLWAELDTTIETEPRTAGFVDFCAKHCAATWPVARWISRELSKAQ